MQPPSNPDKNNILKRMEQALLHSQERLRLAEDLVGLSLYEWNAITGELVWEPRQKAMWGLPPDAQVHYKMVFAAIHPDDRSTVEAAFSRALDPSGDGLYAAEYRVIGIRDGVERWVSSRSRVSFADGRPTGLIGTVIDITDRKRAEEKLRQSEERLRHLLAIMPAAVHTCDAEGRITFFNRRAAELWGREPELGASDQKFCGSLRLWRTDGRLLPHNESPMALAVREGLVARDMELVIEQPSGARTIVKANIDPLRDREGRLVGAINVFEDITERKRLEKEILEAGERERQRIGQDLHDDLCQRLTGIAFTSRLLLQRLARRLPKEADTAREIVHSVQEVNARARDLAKGLHPVKLEANGLAAALRELATTVESVFHVSCRVRCSARLSTTRVIDPTVAIQLYRIAQEATTNAVKHGKARKINIRLSIARGRMKLTIADDGVGITDPASRKGMGLSVMHQRAGAIGAALTIARGKHGGTIVTCSLKGPQTGK